MEIRARYILIGGFLLTAIVGVFAFIFWLENSGGFRERANYQIRFDGAVSGLFTGSAVLFNGIRVGEVTGLGIRADAPSDVTADIAIDAEAPIRADTVIDIEYQGLTGIAAISLNGGKGDAPLVETSEGIPVLHARQGAGLTMTQSAREALLKIHGILDDNSESFREMISNINEFAKALSRNSGKVDGILSGLERMTGGERGPDTEKIYDLIAANDFSGEAMPLQGLLTIPPPTALFSLDTQNIVFVPARNEAPLPPGPRWADTLTRLVQSKVSQSFENAGYGKTVGQNDALIGDFQLLMDIRNFQLISKPEAIADISFFAKIVSADGKIVAAKLFEATAPAASTETSDAVAALRDAFSAVSNELVSWAAESLKGKPDTGNDAASEEAALEPETDAAAIEETAPEPETDAAAIEQTAPEPAPDTAATETATPEPQPQPSDPGTGTAETEAAASTAEEMKPDTGATAPENTTGTSIQ